MKITDAFMGEHAVLYAQLDHLEEAVPRAKTAGEVKAMAAMLEAALASHAQLEDELLLDSLQPGLAQMGKLEKVQHEHDGICSGLAQVRTVRTRAEAQRRLLAVVQMAREEFDLEERVIFRIAEDTMHAETLEKLGRSWARKRALPLR
jgi:hemerythrin-like domain-containing protein